MPTSQLELVSQLKQANILKTPQVILSMQNCDRHIFTNDKDPYENKPLNIGHDEVMTTPSTHAITLELLFSFIKKNCKILDLGCGTGYLSQCLAELNYEGTVLGVDFHKGLIAKAKSINSHKNLEFRHCDAFEVIEDNYNIINVGFAASEDLYKHLIEKVNNGALLCPVVRNGIPWIFNHENKEEILGEVGFSPMRVHQDLKIKLEEIEKKIMDIYKETEQNIGKRPNINDFPKEIHEILRQRRVLQAKLKRQSKHEEQQDL